MVDFHRIKIILDYPLNGVPADLPSPLSKIEKIVGYIAFTALSFLSLGGFFIYKLANRVKVGSSKPSTSTKIQSVFFKDHKKKLTEQTLEQAIKEESEKFNKQQERIFNRFTAEQKINFSKVLDQFDQLIKQCLNGDINQPHENYFCHIELLKPHVAVIHIKEQILVKMESISSPPKPAETYLDRSIEPTQISICIEAKNYEFPFSTLNGFKEILMAHLFDKYSKNILGVENQRGGLPAFFLFLRGLEKDPFDDKHIMSVEGVGKPIYINQPKLKLDRNGLSKQD